VQLQQWFCPYTLCLLRTSCMILLRVVGWADGVRQQGEHQLPHLDAASLRHTLQGRRLLGCSYMAYARCLPNRRSETTWTTGNNLLSLAARCSCRQSVMIRIVPAQAACTLCGAVYRPDVQCGPRAISVAAHCKSQALQAQFADHMVHVAGGLHALRVVNICLARYIQVSSTLAVGACRPKGAGC
jgi:hypothetical protein